MKRTLDRAIVERGLTKSRSQADSYIKLGLVTVNKRIIYDASYLVIDRDILKITAEQQYVSRAALKLASAVDKFGLDFKSKNVLDVGSSTGGFSDYVLRHGAVKVIAVEIGSNQLHPSLKLDKRIELHEKTDIRDINNLSTVVDIILVDVSFVSLKDILPKLYELADLETLLLVLFKPQFEADDKLKNIGIIKNDRIRRSLNRKFENWLRNNNYLILNKSDSSVSGAMGNLESFYLLKPLQKNKM